MKKIKVLYTRTVYKRAVFTIEVEDGADEDDIYDIIHEMTRVTDLDSIPGAEVNIDFDDNWETKEAPQGAQEDYDFLEGIDYD